MSQSHALPTKPVSKNLPSIACFCLLKQRLFCAEDIFEELDKYGEIENLNICDNLADHMVGSVYAKFKDENDAARAMQVCQLAKFHLKTMSIVEVLTLNPTL